MRWIGAAFLTLCLAAPPGGVPVRADADDGAPPSPSLQDVARRIQIVCFESYPERLVRRMSGRPGPVPEDVRADPHLQVKYLKSEWVVRKGLFYPTWLDELLPALQAAVRPGARFLDLGSGDGRVVFMAAAMGARATGIEFDRKLHRMALDARGRLGDVVDVDRAVLKRGDFFKEDLSGYDVLFYFGSGSSAESTLLAKLRREMRPDAVLVLAHLEGQVPGFSRLARYGVAATYRPGP
jgi:SAM-dependent methyltransferase